MAKAHNGKRYWTRAASTALEGSLCILSTQCSKADSIPSGMVSLKTLKLDRNRLANMPRGVTNLSALEILSAADQAVSFQVDEPLHLEAMPCLRTVDLIQLSSADHAWSLASLMHLVLSIGV